MSKDANSFGHDKALAWESRGFVYTKKRMHRFDTPSFIGVGQMDDELFYLIEAVLRNTTIEYIYP